MRFLLLLTLLLPCFTQAAQITDARIWASDERTRFVIDVTEQPTYRDFALSNPSRHVIDISGVVSAVNFGKLLKVLG